MPYFPWEIDPQTAFVLFTLCIIFLITSEVMLFYFVLSLVLEKRLPPFQNSFVFVAGSLAFAGMGLFLFLKFFITNF